MNKISSGLLPLMVITAALFLFACDDYNIVEPRFYDEDDILFHIPQSQDTIYINYALPWDSRVQVFILESAGNIVKTIDCGQMSAGYHAVICLLEDNEGKKLEKGIYCISLTAHNIIDLRWFTID